MQLETGIDDPGAPELFTERMLQAQLEENYEKFCRRFLPTAPAAYALRPDTKFDQRLPMLRKQRQLFHLAVFECICINFKPLLSLDAAQIAGLPGYKQALLSHQRVRLARAALALLDSVTTLQTLLGLDLLGARHSCLSIISYACFEAGALLACLAMPASKLDSLEPAHRAPDLMFQLLSDPLAHLYPYITRRDHTEAIEKALKSLELLSGVSMMARAGAKRLTKLLERARTNMGSTTGAAADADKIDTANGSEASPMELKPVGASNAETSLSGTTYLGGDSFEPPSHHHFGTAASSASDPQPMQGIVLQLETLSEMELLTGFPDMADFLNLGNVTPDTGGEGNIDDFQTLPLAWAENDEAFVREFMQC